jgi:hypothetical protein
MERDTERKNKRQGKGVREDKRREEEKEGKQ